MQAYKTIAENLKLYGFAVVEPVYTMQEVLKMIEAIEAVKTDKPTFRLTESLFTIRQLIKEIPNLYNLVFSQNLLALINAVFGNAYFVVKSIYFDKPPASNWFVSRHQDLTISVRQKAALEGYGPWTVKQQQYAVQPPLPILENNFTIRIHLDDTDENNGALKVVPGSHTQGVIRPETLKNKMEAEVTCTVKRGAVMLMKPLLLHSSGRTTNNQRRRVIHIEFSRQHLPEPLQWSEYLCIH